MTHPGPFALCPLLARFAVPPLDGSAPLDGCAAGTDGLLRSAGTTRPLIDHLIAESRGGAITTLNTRSAEPADPDLVRPPARRTDLNRLLITSRTFAAAEPADPDLVRPRSR